MVSPTPIGSSWGRRVNTVSTANRHTYLLLAPIGRAGQLALKRGEVILVFSVPVAGILAPGPLPGALPSVSLHGTFPQALNLLASVASSTLREPAVSPKTAHRLPMTPLQVTQKRPLQSCHSLPFKVSNEDTGPGVCGDSRNYTGRSTSPRTKVTTTFSAATNQGYCDVGRKVLHDGGRANNTIPGKGIRAASLPTYQATIVWAENNFKG